MEAMAGMNQENMDHELEARYEKYKGILMLTLHTSYTKVLF